MTEETLRLIHDEAMVCASCIKKRGWDITYEWKLCGYLKCMWDLRRISFAEMTKIQYHYNTYFKELK